MDPERVGRQGYFVWENKQGSEAGDRRQGHGRRSSDTWNASLNKAFAQARRYACHLPGFAPPFLVVCDVGHYFEARSDFSGSGRLYEAGTSRRFSIGELTDLRTASYLRRLLTDPLSLDPARYQQRISVEVAADLARISAALEESGEPAGVVARFLMRCLFAMFAEDTELLRAKSFSTLLSTFQGQPDVLSGMLDNIFSVMDRGGLDSLFGRVPQFNGGLFAGSCSVRLNAAAAEALVTAASRDWSEVEPSIFGTLVEQALDPAERHGLGAHFTPRAYIERLVRPTVIEPLRDDWLKVRAVVWEVLGDGEPTARAKGRAIDILQAFHAKLCQVRVLDPACGTGNFLYVTYDLLKDLEAEVLRAMADLGQRQEGLAGLQGATVSPAQLLGVERNPRAREIADLVLWIGHLQRTRRDRGSAAIGEPILRTLNNIEGRDAVLRYDGVPVPRRDETGAVVTVWDMGSKKKTDAVTGRKVPDAAQRVTVVDYPGAVAAIWPEADFIVSNPPFIGNKVMREALGDGYAEALRAAWPAVPAGVDLVMYWWEKAATLCRAGSVRRFGFITTNSITQVSNRAVLEPHMAAGLRLLFAVPDHPWVMDAPNLQTVTRRGKKGEKIGKAANVRIAMSVAGMEGPAPRIVRVMRESWSAERELPEIVTEETVVSLIHSDLSGGANVAAAVPLKANQGVCFQGMNLVGKGFRLEAEEVVAMGYDLNNLPDVIRRHENARDITQGGDPRYVIDLYGLKAEEARERYPRLYQRLLDTVKPERDQNKRASRRDRWWLFGEMVPALRRAWAGLSFVIVTPETAKHRFFVKRALPYVPDHKLYALCLPEAWQWGALSSRFHAYYALAAGGRMGVGNDPIWNNTLCFLTFPFPDPTPDQRAQIGALAEQLDAHRSRIEATAPKAYLTAQYNALVRLREARAGGKALDATERAFHNAAEVGILADLHEALDSAVAEAYGWPADLTEAEILTRLVALNQERAAEEAAGQVRYLRPDFQVAAAPVTEELFADGLPVEGPTLPTLSTEPGPRLLALRDAIRVAGGPLRPEEVAARFMGAVAGELTGTLDLLVQLGVLVEQGGAYSAV